MQKRSDGKIYPALEKSLCMFFLEKPEADEFCEKMNSTLGFEAYHVVLLLAVLP